MEAVYSRVLSLEKEEEICCEAAVNCIRREIRQNAILYSMAASEAKAGFRPKKARPARIAPFSDIKFRFDR